MPFLLLVLTALGLFWCTSLAAAASVTLAWDASAAPELAGYKLYYGYASRSYRLSVNVGQATTAALSGLDEAKVYYLAVVAYDAHGNESDFSNEVIYDLETVDTDGDGLNDWDEIDFYKTDPNKADTDGDGIDDGVEINEDHTNPNVADTPPPPGPPAPPPQSLVRVAVNVGGSQFTAADGTIYQADTLFSGGSTYQTTATIADTTDDALYQSERYGNFGYNVPVDNGNYVVTLKFAESYFSAPGMRAFDVFIEGAKVVSNLDVFAQVGKNRAHDVTVSVGVTDGMLNITFRSLINNAEVNAIVIDRDSDNDGSPNPADPGAVPGADDVRVAVNVGGSQFTAADGTIYQADTLFSGGSTYQTTATIADTTDDALYQSERYGNFGYNVPVDNGNYVVTLKFAESYFSAPGMRAFDVFIEGAKVVSNLDVFAQVGKNRAHDVTVSVGVTDGMLNITFRSLINNAKVNAIVIKTP